MHIMWTEVLKYSQQFWWAEHTLFHAVYLYIKSINAFQEMLWMFVEETTQVLQFCKVIQNEKWSK